MVFRIGSLPLCPSSIYNEFCEHGHWVVQKTHNHFSAMPIDQAHEQNNAIVKGSGGAVGLTENPSAFKKWMVAGPEQARLTTEFEEQYLPKPELHLHHEESYSELRKLSSSKLQL